MGTLDNTVLTGNHFVAYNHFHKCSMSEALGSLSSKVKKKCNLLRCNWADSYNLPLLEADVECPSRDVSAMLGWNLGHGQLIPFL